MASQQLQLTWVLLYSVLVALLGSHKTIASEFALTPASFLQLNHSFFTLGGGPDEEVISDPMEHISQIVLEYKALRAEAGVDGVHHLNRVDTYSEPVTSGVSLMEVGAQVTSKTGTGVGIVRAYCEICILVMQMKERGSPHLCAGLNTNYYITCVEILESLLRADKALVYWLKNGCMHIDTEGPEIVRPCPALSVCSWVPNLFAQPPSVVRDGIEALCPKDPKFLPKIPEEFATRAATPTTLPLKV